VAEHVATRRAVGLFDLTPLRRVEVEGAEALTWLERICSAELDRTVGTAAYTLLLGPTGTVRTDAVVSRLGVDRFLVGLGTPADVAQLLLDAPGDGSVSVRDVTPGTCALGLWGPRAADVLEPLVPGGVDASTFGRFQVRELDVGGMPVVAQSVSYVGQAGWELSITTDLGLRLWDLVWEAGRDHGLVAAGRRAFETLRLEAGYAAAGVDVTSEHDPVSAGLGRFVRHDAMPRPGARVLARLEVDGIVSGGEPVRASRATIGYVSSGGRADGRGFAFAWLDRGHPADVEVIAFDRPMRARVMD
jgi:glycine cleavage system aminomethyltransferase T